MLKANTIKRGGLCFLLSGGMLVGPLGCEELPGTSEQQGAVIGGTAGAATGAIVAGEDNRLLGALIGGALGAGGGYLIGANKDKILGDEDEDAARAVENAQSDPADASDVFASDTADLNSDGFVTMDELVAMEEAGLTDDQIIDRLEATDQVFELTPAQEEQLRDQGVSQRVVSQLDEINQDLRRDVIERRQNRDVISSDPDAI